MCVQREYCWSTAKCSADEVQREEVVQPRTPTVRGKSSRWVFAANGRPFFFAISQIGARDAVDPSGQIGQEPPDRMVEGCWTHYLAA